MITQQDLRDFQIFASEKLATSEVESMAELVRLWEASRQHQQSLAALRQSHQDAQAGRLVPAEEVFADARKTLGISE